MRIRTVALSVAAALTLAACASGSDVDVAEPVAIDATAGEDAEGGAPDAEEQPAAEPVTDGAALLAAAVDGAASQTARMSFSSRSVTPDGVVIVEGEGVSGVDGTAQISLVIRSEGVEDLLGSGQIEIIVLDGVIYQRFDTMTEAMGIDATWLAFDIDQLGPEYEDLLDQASSADPSEQLAYLREAGDVVEIGPSEINGVATTHYRAKVDLAALLEAQGLSDAGDVAAGAGVVPMDVHLDADGLVRRTVTETEVDGIVVESTVDVLEYGITLDVVAPPADDTMDFSAFLEGGAGGG